MATVESIAAEQQGVGASDDAGRQMYALVERLYPICRSITGSGVRESLALIGQYIDLQMHEVPSGTRVFDWEVPREWNIRGAYIQAPDGRRVVDFAQSNLHVMGYSIPVRAHITWCDLQSRLHSLPQHPDWVPYRTSYYQENWGFCLAHRQRVELEQYYGDDALFEVCIDSSLGPGALSYGELYLPGCTTDEVLFSAHVCHPSLANDNLSGIAVATWLAQHVAAIANRRYSYRFLFLPVTIGAITWLARNEQTAQRIKHGLVLSLLGDPGKMHYKRSRQGNALVDRAAAHVLEQSGEDFGLLEFEPYGYDERQFCSPGFNLPVGCLTRTPYGRYPQYHTSADNLDLVQPAALADSLACCTSIVEILEQDGRYLNTNPKCEPQLGRRGLYRALGGELDGAGLEKAMLWVLNLSDGDHTLLDIAQRSQLPFRRVQRAAELLLKHALLREADPQ